MRLSRRLLIVHVEANRARLPRPVTPFAVSPLPIRCAPELIRDSVMTVVPPLKLKISRWLNVSRESVSKIDGYEIDIMKLTIGC